MARKSSPDFEQSLAELETLVESLETGDMSLEESLKAFEQGMALTRRCQDTLAKAEQKVQKLVEQDGELRTEPLDDEAP